MKKETKKRSSSKEESLTKNKIQKKETKEQNSIKEILTSKKALTIYFFTLLIIVIILGVLINQKEKEKKESFDSNISLSIFELNPSFTFGIDTAALSRQHDKTYVIKLTNYKGDYIHDENLDYQLLVENNTKAKITLTKNDSNKDLIETQKSTLLHEQMEKSSEKQNVYYYIHLTSNKKLSDREFIKVKVIRESALLTN